VHEHGPVGFADGVEARGIDGELGSQRVNELANEGGVVEAGAPGAPAAEFALRARRVAAGARRAGQAGRVVVVGVNIPSGVEGAADRSAIRHALRICCDPAVLLAECIKGMLAGPFIGAVALAVEAEQERDGRQSADCGRRPQNVRAIHQPKVWVLHGEHAV